MLRSRMSGKLDFNGENVECQYKTNLMNGTQIISSITGVFKGVQKLANTANFIVIETSERLHLINAIDLQRMDIAIEDDTQSVEKTQEIEKETDSQESKENKVG